jgi:hypothetical protein
MAPIRIRSPVTALSLESIPSHINTYERLAVYAIQVLQNTCNGLTINVQQNQGQQPAAQCSVATTADNVPRFILSAYLPVDLSGLNSATEKTWMAALDLSNAEPHSNFETN